MSKKLIICYTGVPRSLIKGLQSRNKMLSERYFSDFFIESRYLICFLRKNKKNRFKIFNRSNLFHKDNNLKILRIEERKSKNIWEHIIQQKYDILHELKKDLNKKDDSTILLTRTDWFFTKNCLNLINLSIQKQKVITPYFSEKIESCVIGQVPPFANVAAITAPISQVIVIEQLWKYKFKVFSISFGPTD